MAKKLVTLKKKITIFTILISGLGMLILTVAAAVSIFSLSNKNATDAVLEVAEVAAERASWEVMSYSNLASELGVNEILCDPNSTEAQKNDILNKRAEQYGLQRCNYIDSKGMGIDGNDYSDRAYFQAAMDGRSLVSDPLISKRTGKLTIIVAAPLWKDGIAGGTPIGCVYVVPDEEFLNDIVRSITYGEEGTAFILSKDGVLIADNDTENVKNTINFNELGGTAAELAQKMASHEAASCRADIFGTKMFVGYTSIPNSNDWTLAVCGPVSEHIKTANSTILLCIIILAAVAVVSGFFAAVVGKRIGDPIKKCTDRMLLLSKGDISSDVPKVKSDDETQLLANATETVVNSLNSIINDIGRILEKTANGDLSVDTKVGEAFYIGDYAKLLSSIELIKENLCATMNQITTAADQVS